MCSIIYYKYNGESWESLSLLSDIPLYINLAKVAIGRLGLRFVTERGYGEGAGAHPASQRGGDRTGAHALSLL